MTPCPSCGEPMKRVQQVTVEVSIVDVPEDEGGGKKTQTDDQRCQTFWECKPCKVSRPGA